MRLRQLPVDVSSGRRFRYMRLRRPRGVSCLSIAGAATRIMLCVTAMALTAATELSFPTTGQQFRIQVVASELTYPWSLAVLPNHDILITEKPGRLRVLRKATLQLDLVTGLPHLTNLLDVVLDPRFIETKLIYFTLTRSESTSGSAQSVIGLEVWRATLDDMRLTDQQAIFLAEPKLPGLTHFGGRLLFLPDGTLLVTIGDGTLDGQFAQKSDTHLGKTIRIYANGTHASNSTGDIDEQSRHRVHTSGHRNSQGIALRANGEVWQHEHGPIGGDEINLLTTGSNYGWPIVTTGQRHLPIRNVSNSAQLFSDPVITWESTVAPSGMVFYEGTAFPEWRGSLFIGSLQKRALLRISLAGTKLVNEEVLLTEINERIRDVRLHPDGSLYVLTDSTEGRLLRVYPASKVEH